MARFLLFIFPILLHIGTLLLIGAIYTVAMDPGILMVSSENLKMFLEDPWGQYDLVACAALLLILELEYLLLRARQARRTRFIVLNRYQGRVSISVTAIEDFILKISKGFSEIKSIKPYVSSEAKTIKILLSVALWSGHNILNFAEVLKKNIRSQIQNILGLEREVKIAVRVKEIQENRIEVFQDRMFRGIETQ